MTDKSLWPDWQTQEDGRQFAPAAERNKDYILELLKQHLPKSGTVLELASGTGEHAKYFAPNLAPLFWQPSDYLDDKLASIAAWSRESGCANLLPPIKIDTTTPIWPCETKGFFDQAQPISAIVCINMIHISPWAATLGLLEGAKRLLPKGGILFFYGPYMQSGQHTAPSNQAFDEKLKATDPSWGLRDIDVVTKEAQTRGLQLMETIAMPANNFSLLFKKT